MPATDAASGELADVNGWESLGRFGLGDIHPACWVDTTRTVGVTLTSSHG